MVMTLRVHCHGTYLDVACGDCSSKVWSVLQGVGWKLRESNVSMDATSIGRTLVAMELSSAPWALLHPFSAPASWMTEMMFLRSLGFLSTGLCAGGAPSCNLCQYVLCVPLDEANVEHHLQRHIRVDGGGSHRCGLCAMAVAVVWRRGAQGWVRCLQVPPTVLQFGARPTMV